MTEHTLPIWNVMPTIISSLQGKRNVIVTAPTGSGKTTQVPQAIYDSGVAGDGNILVIEPRRVACRAVARRVASERGESSGGTIGYIVRYEGRVTDETRLCFVTDGVLIRFLERDPLLKNVGAVIFDEFHERRALSDIALALLKRAQSQRTDLRLVVMSATMDADRIAAYLDADVVTAEGRTFEVQITHLPKRPAESDLPRVTAKLIRDLHATRPAGDILAFLPGKREIVKTQALLDGRVTGATVLPLYGELDRIAQDAVFAPVAGRKVVLATNVAETSLTIPGVTLVIDSGLERRANYNHRTAMTSLTLTRISRSSADQRAGRAGRVQPGECVRLWSAEEHEHLDASIPPEIQRMDVASAILTLKSVGVDDVASFDFLDAPAPKRLVAAEKLLSIFGALDEHGSLTRAGRQMLRLPLSPRCAKMIVEAERSRCLNEISTVVSLLSGRPLFTRPPGRGKDAQERQRDFARDDSSDFFTSIEVYRQWRSHGYRRSWCKANFLNYEALVEARNLRRKVLQVCFRRGSVWNVQPALRQAVRRCIASGLVDRVARRLDAERYVFATGSVAERDGGSVVSGDIVVTADARLIVGRKGKEELTIFSLATAVTRAELEQLALPLFARRAEVLEFFPVTGTARVREHLRYLDMSLESRERYVSWAEAWKMFQEISRQAELSGYVRVEVVAEPRGAFSVTHEDHKVFVNATETGTYWASVRGSPDQPSIRLHFRCVEVPSPGKGMAAPTLGERLSRLAPALQRLNRRS